ncbi:MAG: glycosyltransferase family 2 protein [Desulfosarcina sp.]|nr:glycosyltransferase family 2 protein [Desulfosarcina sp.]
MNISVIICTKNRSQDLKVSLDSIINQSILPDEIIVVDSSTNFDTKLLCKNYKNIFSIPLFYYQTAPGLTKQRNIGVKHSSKEIIAFIDDDVILEESYFKEIKEAFAVSDKILGVGGRILNVKPDALFSGILKKIFLLTEFAEKKGIVKKSGFARFPYGHCTESFLPTQVIMGCSSSYRRGIFDEYKFDEYFEGYSVMEDVEFSYRISKQGLLIYWPAAKLIHKKSPLDRNSTAQRYEMLILNYFYVFKKNVKRSPFDWIFFYWSLSGLKLHAIYFCLKLGTISPLLGVYSAYRKLLSENLDKH